jgi:hypothetical protein
MNSSDKFLAEMMRDVIKQAGQITIRVDHLEDADWYTTFMFDSGIYDTEYTGSADNIYESVVDLWKKMFTDAG